MAQLFFRRALRLAVLVVATAFLIVFLVGYSTHGDAHKVQFRLSVTQDGRAIADPILPVRLRLVWLRGAHRIAGVDVIGCEVDADQLPGTFRVPVDLGGDTRGRVSTTTLTCDRAVYGVEGIDFSR